MKKKRWLSLLLALAMIIMSVMPMCVMIVAADDDEISLMSLLPLKEVKVDLPLSGFSKDELAEIPLQTVLGLLVDKNGDPVEIAEDAVTVWTSYTDQYGFHQSNEYGILDKDATLDLSCVASDDFRTYYDDFQIIVGSGKQLDPNNVRYFVTAHYFSKDINFSMAATRDDGTLLWNAYYDSYRTTIPYSEPDDPNIIQTKAYYIFSEYEGPYCIKLERLSSADAWSENVELKVYALSEFLKYLDNGSGEPVEIMEGSFSRHDDPAVNTYIIAYIDTESSKLLDYKATTFIVEKEKWFDGSKLDGSIYAYSEEDGMQDVVTYRYNSSSYNYTSQTVGVDLKNGTVELPYRYAYIDYSLQEGYGTDDELYFVLSDIERQSEVSESKIEKIINAIYYWDNDTNTSKFIESIEDAEGYEDIKDQLIHTDGAEAPYGYKLTVNSYGYIFEYFTVFYDDGYVYQFEVYAFPTSSGSSTSTPTISNKPLKSYYDPYFRIQGAYADKIVNSYVVDYDNAYDNLDTYYRYGYQTILLNDKDIDMSQLKPTFYIDTDNGAHAYDSVTGTEQKSGESVQDFSDETVEYTVAIDDGKRNYFVTFVKKETGPKLFVNGPDEREIFLDEYFENVHDIFIANVGDQPLTGIKAELIDAQNVKLDEYWTVGGKGNDTLAAFTRTSRNNSYYDEELEGWVYENYSYGEIPNVAKIRLVPDGEGEVSGTLKISADGQEDVYINLIGYAGNPKIVTKDIPEAVKYVPYSAIVATDNIHDWNEVTFRLLSGRLPTGVTMNTKTGEIYGVPKETGEFSIIVQANFSESSFKSVTADFTLTVNGNTNDNVFNATDENYQILEFIGEQQGDTHEFILDSIDDQLFVSNGEMGEFIDLWLNGEKLVEGDDYTVESGSTRITIMGQTFANKANLEGANTIAAEFRVDGDENNELKRTAQNFSMHKSSEDEDDGSDSTDTGSSGSVIATDTDNNNTDNGTGNGSGTGTGTSGGTGTGSGTNTTGSNNGNDSSIAPSVKYVSFSGYLVDPAGEPLSGLTIELHSEPKTTVSDANGYFRFDDVEYGQHTLYVKDANGNVMASKTFNIIEGSSGIITAGDISAEAGSLISVEAEINGDQIIFNKTRVESPDAIPNTANSIDTVTIYMLAALAVCISTIGIYSKLKVFGKK